MKFGAIHSKKTDVFIFITGCCFALILRLIFPEIHHLYDVWTFIDWGKHATNFQNIYTTDCYCNYPILGLLASTGLLKLLHFSIFKYLLFLAIIDGINILLLAAILKQLKVHRAYLFAGIIALLPALWVGGGFWGQIDNIGQSLLLLIIYLFILLFKSSKLSSRLMVLSLIGFSFASLMLLKQLLLFSVFALVVVLLTYLLKTNESFKYKGIQLSVLISSVLLPIFAFDFWLNIPNQYYFFHLEKVLFEGSDHMNLVAENGIALWNWLFKNPLIASTSPLIFGINSKVLGLLGFVSFLAFCLFHCLKNIRFYNQYIYTVFQTLLFLSLVNLGFNLLLTGTHERYLYHFYPFYGILLAMAKQYKLIQIKKWDYGLFIIGAVIYGLFVLGILLQYHQNNTLFQTFWAHRMVGLFHLIVLIRLVRMQITFKNDNAIIVN